jgi:ABC-type molybdate transport system substrate-binding protein
MEKNSVLKLMAFFFLCTIIILPVSHASAEPAGKLIMFHAGSLSVPFAAM